MGDHRHCGWFGVFGPETRRTARATTGHRRHDPDARARPAPSDVQWNPDGSRGRACRGISTARTPSSTSRVKASPTSAGRRRGKRRCATAASSPRARWCARSRSARSRRRCSSAHRRSATTGRAATSRSPRPRRRVRTFWRGCASNGSRRRALVESPATRLAIVRTGLALASDGGALREDAAAVQARTRRHDRIGRSVHAVDSRRRLDGAGVVADPERSRDAARSTPPRPTPVTNRDVHAHARRACCDRPAVLHAPAFVLQRRAGRNGDDARHRPARAARRARSSLDFVSRIARSNRRCESLESDS